MTEVETKRITTLLVAAYPGWKPSEATLQLYERMLLPLDAGVAQAAVLRIIRSPREFAPPVGSICHEAVRLTLGQGDSGAEAAWAEVAAAIRSHGSYRIPRFANQELAQVVAAMDWKELCRNPNVEATRAHFFRLYEAFHQSTIARRLEELSGGAHCSELAEGWAAPLPIGGPEKTSQTQRGSIANGIEGRDPGADEYAGGGSGAAGRAAGRAA